MNFGQTRCHYSTSENHTKQIYKSFVPIVSLWAEDVMTLGLESTDRPGPGPKPTHRIFLKSFSFKMSSLWYAYWLLYLGLITALFPRYSRPILLYLIFEKSSLKNLVWGTWFLTFKNQFQNWFCSKNPFRNRLKIQFVKLNFSNMIFQKSSTDG